MALLAGLAPAALADCPDADEIRRHVATLGLERTSRVVRFEAETPDALYRKAARKIGHPVIDRVDKKGFGVLVTEVPLEQWWRAINDENRHTGYVPVDDSRVVSGTVRGVERVVFQYAKMFGIGRWWVSRVRMNAELYRASGGTLWELWWEDDLDAADPTKPPIDAVASDLPPIERTRGSWLLAPLGKGCTLVELFNWSEAGGAVGAIEGLATKRSLRKTLEGIQRLAGEMTSTAAGSEPPFVRPDGTPLATAPATAPAE